MQATLQHHRTPGTNGVKVILLGDSNVGKTSLLHRVKEGTFAERGAQPTIGCSFCTHTVALERGAQLVSLALWDTAGQEKYRSFTRQYFRGASAAALLYDITKADSFSGAKSWLRDVKAELGESIVLLLVGSKLDLAAERVVSTQSAAEFAAAEGATYFECSSKEGTNVDTVFESIARQLIKNGMAAGKEKLPFSNAPVSVVTPGGKRLGGAAIGCCDQ